MAQDINLPASSNSTAAERRKKQQQPRQLLSCTKCRERKVKCDRTKPCSACCARGHPRECHFVVGEGNDYSPIQQSYEIRKLRQENQRLKEKLQAARLPHSGDEEDEFGLSDREGSKSTARASAARQRRFKTGERIDNIYFGTPGLTNIISEFANLSVKTSSLTHPMPKGPEMYHTDHAMYPFPTMWLASGTIEALVGCLPEREELFDALESFYKRGQCCSFPHVPDEVTKKEVERFLSDAEANAQKFPDMLALVFATLATGMQMGVWDRSGGCWVQGEREKATQKSDVYIAASMQALRQGSFMNQPTLLGIQALVMLGPYLTNSGRFLDAWTLFGTTIRMAHSIGLHRNPKFLDPVPGLRECSVRQTLWWWMLHMDQQYSVTLGRPLGISGFGDCPPPEPLTSDVTVLRLSDFIDHFTILARQILSSDHLMSVAKIDEFTDKLLGLWDKMPESLQFNQSWLHPDTQIPDWPLDVMSATVFAKVQSFIILLNRQRVERTQNNKHDHSPPQGSMGAPSRQQTTSYYPSGDGERMHQAPIRGRDVVINSSTLLLQVFLFFYHKNPGVLICWTIGQQAFNAAMILILDAWETENERDMWLVNQVYVVFLELDQKGVHKLAEMAVKRIADGLAALGHREQERQAAASRRASEVYHHPVLSMDPATLPDLSRDSVMGDTGMFLLEDQGLQSLAPPQHAFQPLGWEAVGSAPASQAPSGTTTPALQAPHIPISEVQAAPFPMMSPTYVQEPMQVGAPHYPVGMPPQPQQQQQQQQQHQQQHPQQHPQQQQQQQQQHQQHQQHPVLPPGHYEVNEMGEYQMAAFTPINNAMPASNMPPAGYAPSHAQMLQQQHPPQQAHPPQPPPQGPQSFPHHQGPRHNSIGVGPRGAQRPSHMSRSQQRRR
ncbi:hypothetical protein MBLNU230_g6190t1 [Neophaeotheca triangularis]